MASNSNKFIYIGMIKDIGYIRKENQNSIIFDCNLIKMKRRLFYARDKVKQNVYEPKY